MKTSRLTRKPAAKPTKATSSPAAYSAITIIYNPRSTHSGKSLAHDLKKKLTELLPQPHISIVSTNSSGHAAELAYEHAMSSAHPLVISASGDGGYHEVINGLMRARAEGAEPVAGLLPAGNANDHFRHLHEADITASITSQSERIVDLLKVTYRHAGAAHSTYVHSYVGVGITSQAGDELNSHHLNWFVERWIVAKAMFFPRHVRLEINGRASRYDSVILSNTSRMAKVLNLSDVARIDDGKFEVNVLPANTRFHLIANILLATVRGLRSRHQVTDFRFMTLEPTVLQMDGEIVKLAADTKIRVTIEPAAIACIV